MLLVRPSVILASVTDGFDKEYWMKRYLSVNLPLQNIVVTSPYGMRKDPLTGKSAFHSGIDLRAKFENVYAMFDGVVSSTGEDIRSGMHVQLTHGNITVSYCHLSKVLVKKGDMVLSGDVVGISGNSGRTTGPHLHLTAKADGRYINPTMLFAYVKSVRDEAMGWLRGSSSTAVFIDRFKEQAKQHEARFGIPASVTLAQMAVESQWGRSRLAREANNYFGIKCTQAWLDNGKPYILCDDDKKNEKFCVFASPEESMDYHSQILLSERYQSCRKHPVSDYRSWLECISTCGYATDSDYVNKCVKVIEKHSLHRL